jgi:small subunit ribosomal protein S16
VRGAGLASRTSIWAKTARFFAATFLTAARQAEFLTQLRSIRETRMVILRLARRGTKKRPYYHIVATDNASRRDGRFIEQVGTYDPCKPDTDAHIEQERLEYWVSVGAQLSERVGHIVRAKKKAAASA